MGDVLGVETRRKVGRSHAPGAWRAAHQETDLAPATSAFATRPAAPAAPARRRSRAKPKPPRPRIVAMSDLRALGYLVYEQALLDRTARPQESVVAWAGRIAFELDVEGPGAPADYADLLQAILRITRAAKADPQRPMVAIPPAA